MANLKHLTDTIRTALHTADYGHGVIEAETNDNQMVIGVEDDEGDEFFITITCA